MPKQAHYVWQIQTWCAQCDGAHPASTSRDGTQTAKGLRSPELEVEVEGRVPARKALIADSGGGCYRGHRNLLLELPPWNPPSMTPLTL